MSASDVRSIQSPYWLISGRERYLETVIPQAASSVMKLTVDEVIVIADPAAFGAG